MKTVAPDYYNSFFCIADKCKHSCCVGWEIDIDAAALDSYNGTRGDFGDRLRESIAYSTDTAYFKLTEDERCPFLNERGLCDIISQLGEDSLCNICADHPRFRSFFSDRTEIGLGLCCEAAAELILSRKEPVRLVTLEDDGEHEQVSAFEKELLNRRDELFALLQDRTLQIDRRVKNALSALNASMPQITLEKWADIYSKLEQLDTSWQRYIELLRVEKHTSQTSALDIAYEQLLVYFVYRHTSAAEDIADLAARTAFAVLGYKMIRALCERLDNSFVTLCELARSYSSEIEYSEENTARLIEILKEEC